jgi:hypothetical protein
MDAAALLFTFLPSKSVFISIQHGPYAFGINHLQQLRIQRGLQPRVIYHLNHERPWCTDPYDNLDFMYEDIQQLLDEYSHYDLVFRNYYYSPMIESTSPSNMFDSSSSSNSHTNRVIYLPVGVPYYRFILGYSQQLDGGFNSVKADMRLLASQRPLHCFFRGRVDYDFGTRAASLLQEEHAIARRELSRLHGAGQLDACLVEIHNPLNNKDGRKQYEDYIAVMAKTKYALCPLGNNPETFRLHEVPTQCSLRSSSCLESIALLEIHR